MPADVCVGDQVSAKVMTPAGHRTPGSVCPHRGQPHRDTSYFIPLHRPGQLDNISDLGLSLAAVMDGLTRH